MSPGELMASDPKDVVVRPPLSHDEARRLTDEANQTLEEFQQRMIFLFEGKADVALGYKTWPEYVRAEFKMLPRMGRLERRDAVRELSAAGMSIREVAATVNTSKSSVADDLSVRPRTGRSHEPSAGAVVGTAPADSSPQDDDEQEGVTAAEDEREDQWPDVPTPGGVVESATPGNATGEAPADEDPALRYRSWRSSARRALDSARGELRLVTGDFLEPGTVAERADEPLLIALEQLSRELGGFIAAVRELRTAPVVWVATTRRGIEYHEPLPGGGRTMCGRSTRTGSILPRAEVVEQYDGKACTKCWPDGTVG
jgi:hypothetical protein